MPENTVTVGALEDRLSLFMRTHHRTMHRYFQSVGMFNGHPHMLFHIAHCPGISQKELAARMEISPASVAISIRRLESAGLIRRQRDDRDARTLHLYLTPAGAEMDAACARGRDFLMDTLYRGFTPTEQQELYRLLDKMIVNLQVGCETLPPEKEGMHK